MNLEFPKYVDRDPDEWFEECLRNTKEFIERVQRRTWDFWKKSSIPEEITLGDEWALVWKEAGRSDWFYEQANWNVLKDDAKHYEGAELINIYVGWSCYDEYIAVRRESEGMDWMHDNAYSYADYPCLAEDEEYKLKSEAEREYVDDYYFDDRAFMSFPDGWVDDVFKALYELFPNDELFIEEEPGRLWIKDEYLEEAAEVAGLKLVKRCTHCGKGWVHGPWDNWKAIDEGMYDSLDEYREVAGRDPEFEDLYQKTLSYQREIEARKLTPRFPGFPPAGQLTKPEILSDGEPARLIDGNWELCPVCLLGELVEYYPIDERRNEAERQSTNS